MSELRDLTGALRAFDKRFSSIEECLVVLLRNSTQETEWRHQQKNNAQRELAQTEGFQKAIGQLQLVVGSVSDRVASLVERLDNQASVRLSDIKEVRHRVRLLEIKDETDEVTR